MSKRIFRLRCDDIGQQHTKFTVFDPERFNCGTLTIRTNDVNDFLYYSWKGRLDWNGRERKGRTVLRGGGPAPTELTNNKL